MIKKKAIIVSGYFNPLHKGHIEYFHLAKSNGDKLFVIVNNDVQRKLKNSKKFMLEDERVLILRDELLSTQNPYELLYKKIPEICGTDEPKKLIKEFDKVYCQYGSKKV